MHGHNPAGWHSPHRSSGREKASHQIILALLRRLYSERHPSQVGYHLLGISQCQMAEKTLVILVDVIADGAS